MNGMWILKTLIIVILLCLISLSVLFSCTKKGEPSGNVIILPQATSKEGEDIAFYGEKIAVLHKNAFANVEKNQFIAGCTESISRLDNLPESMSAEERRSVLYFELCRVCAMIGDSHTFISRHDLFFNNSEVFPVTFHRINGKWIVSKIEKSREEYLAAEPVSVNGVPIADVLNRISSIISHDNDIFLLARSREYLQNADALEYLGIIPSDSPMVLSFADGRILELESISLKDAEDLSYTELAAEIPPTAPSEENYRYMPIGADTLFCQYNSCSDMESYSVKQFGTDILEELDSKTYKRVIFDLRYNGGGNSALLDSTIKQIGKKQKQQSFELFVLIGEGTFSSAIINASHFKDWTESVLVGIPTGGSLNHFGEVRGLTMPNSGITGGYSTKYFTMDPDHPEGSFIPDIIVETTLEDLTAGTDTQVEYCLNH